MTNLDSEPRSTYLDPWAILECKKENIKIIVVTGTKKLTNGKNNPT